jgi:protein-S-isoprenylcysteine O-methyltransferase Ste14
MAATWVYLISTVALGLASFALFRVRTRREYTERGRLSVASSILELVLCLAYAAVPYIYNPPCWPWVWACTPWATGAWTAVGYVLIAVGALIAFGSMIWLGLRRSFGQHVGELVQSGPYRFSRNPQVVGGTLLVAGIVVLWPSWFALGWAVLWLVMFHAMVLTEEEHLRRVFGEDFLRYCLQVGRYIGRHTPRDEPRAPASPEQNGLIRSE